jgi:uncharacterized membrane protein
MTNGAFVLTFAIGAALGAGAMYVSLSKPATAQATPMGTFQLFANQSPAGADAWRLNTVTGELVHCWTGSPAGCRKEPTP